MTFQEARNFDAGPHSNYPLELHDVIVCGAGPVGLFLACELALLKCSVLLVERSAHPHSPFKQLPFGLRGLNAPSIRAFQRRGLLADLQISKRLQDPHMGAVGGTRRSVGHFGAIPLLAGNIDEAQWPFHLAGNSQTSLISEMKELETVLTARAEALGVQILRGLAVTALNDAEHGVMVCCGEQRFAGSWLVGCDGARSIVRKLGGFSFPGTEPEFTGYSVSVEIADPEKLKAGRNMTATGMYLQSQPGYIVLQEFDGGAFHRAAKPLSLLQVQAVLRRISNTDVTIRALHHGTTWTDHARQVPEYRRGRVLLAGDAAHIHSPLGGQGLNLGLGDAANLGWKLAATLRGKAAYDLLDTYTAERHPVAARVLDWSRAQVAIMKPEPVAQALRAVMEDLIGTRDGATYVAGRIWGVTANPCSVKEGMHPLTGNHVPAFNFDDETSVDELMLDGRGLLIDFDSQNSLATLASDYHEVLRYVSGRAKEQLGLTTVLVRPDGIVAWASSVSGSNGVLQQAVDNWFVRGDRG